MASGAAKAALFDALASVAQALGQRPPGGDRRRARAGRALGRGARRARSRRASRTRRSTCRCSRGPGWCARGGRERGSSTGWRASGSPICGRRCAMSPSRHVAEVSVLADEYLGERDGVEQLVRRRARSSGSRAATWSCSTCGPSPSTAPGTSPAPVRRRSRRLPSLAPKLPRRRRGRRLLPRPVLRLRRRRGAAAARARSEGAPARRRLSRVAPGRAAGRDRPAERRSDAASPVPERRHLVRELPVRLHDARASSRSSTRTSTSSTTTSPQRPRSARRSWRCSRRTCRPTTSPACRRSSSAPARPPTCPPAPASSSSTSRSPTATSSSSATRS